MGALKVNPLARGVRGNEHVHFRIMFERLLRLQAFLAAHAAVDDNHSLLASEQSSNADFEVAQRIAMLGKDNELLTRRRVWRRNCAGAIGGSINGRLIRNCSRSENIAKQTSELAPLTV